jgi:YHYH protein
MTPTTALPARTLLLAAILSGAAAVSDCPAQSRIDVLDPHRLPLGDGKVSTGPKRGYVYACSAQFRGGGAQHAGDWIHGSTWDATRKINVQGDIAWPDATFGIAAVNGERRVTGNGLPTRHTTGAFPVSRSDPAYSIDRNPNGIAPQQIAFSLPLSPALAGTPQCVPMGMIGVALSGVALFNALDAAGRDAVAHEVQDRCSGHPQMSGQYHYHGPTPCLPAVTSNNALIGYALDGFGIFSMYDERGREITNADLDECHGRVSRINWDGKEVSMYHYVLTREYPYTIGCFRGTPVRLQRRTADGASQSGPPQDRPSQSEPPEARPDGAAPRSGPPGGGRRPPPEAIAACSGRSSSAQCQFVSPRGDSIVGTCQSPGGTLACVPERR